MNKYTLSHEIYDRASIKYIEKDMNSIKCIFQISLILVSNNVRHNSMLC